MADISHIEGEIFMSALINKDWRSPVWPSFSHVPIVILVDKSHSMHGDGIKEINQELDDLFKMITEDYCLLEHIDLMVASFSDSIQSEIGFGPVTEYSYISTSAKSGTSLNEAILVGLDAIAERKVQYREMGISYYRPWLIVLSDWKASDIEIEEKAIERVRSEIRRKRLFFVPIMIGDSANDVKARMYYPEENTKKPLVNANRLSEVFSRLIK